MTITYLRNMENLSLEMERSQVRGGLWFNLLLTPVTLTCY
jgi:hypothetical protein